MSDVSATECSKCGSALEGPLVCRTCGALQDPAVEPSPHAVLGLAPTYAIDARDLERRLMKLSRSMHPDFFGSASPEERELAERNSARLNGAHALLLDPLAHADWWVRQLGGPSEEDERQMPQAFLMEVLEWNETIDEAEGADDRGDRLAPLAALLRDQRTSVLTEIATTLADVPKAPDDLVAVRRQLNAVRYLDRTLTRIRSAAPAR